MLLFVISMAYFRTPRKHGEHFAVTFHHKSANQWWKCFQTLNYYWYAKLKVYKLTIIYQNKLLYQANFRILQTPTNHTSRRKTMSFASLRCWGIDFISRWLEVYDQRPGAKIFHKMKIIPRLPQMNVKSPRVPGEIKRQN